MKYLVLLILGTEQLAAYSNLLLVQRQWCFSLAFMIQMMQHGWLSNYLMGNGKGHLLAAHNHNFLLKILCFLFVTITWTSWD